VERGVPFPTRKGLWEGQIFRCLILNRRILVQTGVLFVQFTWHSELRIRPKSRRVQKSVTNDNRDYCVFGNAVPTVKNTLGTPFPGVPAGNDPWYNLLLQATLTCNLLYIYTVVVHVELVLKALNASFRTTIILLISGRRVDAA